MMPGIAVAASTTRRGVGHVTTLTVRGKFRPGGLIEVLHPKSTTWALRTFNEDIRFPFAVYADWPAGFVDVLPIQPGDDLLLNGITYAIFGVKPHYGDHITLLVQVTPE